MDISGARLDPEAPTSLYFKEWGTLGKLRVHYYRAGSAASRMSFDDSNIDYLLSGEILHLTGIMQALSESCRHLIARLLPAANERNVKVSFDMNVRWTLFEGRDPREILEPLAARADVLFLSDDEAELMFGGWSLRGGRGRHLRKGRGYRGGRGCVRRGVLSGRLRGWSTGDCLGMANACGACAVSVPGDLNGLPTEEEAR